MAYKLMSEQLLTCAKTLFVATQPVWEWYADQVKGIKTPMDCLRETAATTGGQWMSGRELNSLAQIFTSRQALASAGLFDSERPIAAKRLFSLVVNVMRHRAWSHAVIRAVESCPALPNGSLGWTQPRARCNLSISALFGRVVLGAMLLAARRGVGAAQPRQGTAGRAARVILWIADH